MRQWFSRATLGRGFARMLAHISLVDTWRRVIFSSCTHSWMKWYWAWIYLVGAWSSGLFYNSSDPLFSTCRGISVSGCIKSSFKRWQSHKASLQVLEKALYLASVLESETVSCFRDFQETVSLPMWYVYAEVDQKSLQSSAESESE